jgi:hypothetical protein
MPLQEFPGNFADYYKLGVAINACSIRQIKRFGEAFPGRDLGLRINPGIGSGGTQGKNLKKCCNILVSSDLQLFSNFTIMF